MTNQEYREWLIKMLNKICGYKYGNSIVSEAYSRGVLTMDWLNSFLLDKVGNHLTYDQAIGCRNIYAEFFGLTGAEA